MLLSALDSLEIGPDYLGGDYRRNIRIALKMYQPITASVTQRSLADLSTTSHF